MHFAMQAKHHRSYLYHDVPSSYLDWHHRRAAIIAELAHLRPDVICLQVSSAALACMCCLCRLCVHAKCVHAVCVHCPL